jgi:hypothetical protein
LDRLIELEPDQPLFPLEKARSAFAEKTDLKAIRAAHEALPASMKDDVYITWERVYYAMCIRDFAAAGEIVSKSRNEEIRYFGPLVPRRIVALWLELVQGFVRSPQESPSRSGQELVGGAPSAAW